MASYLILGAGKFGRLALQRLWSQDPAGRFVIVDRSRQALDKIPCPPGADVDKIEADVTVFLQENLSRYASWDWLIPMVPGHVALAGLPDVLVAGSGWELTDVPSEVENIARMAIRGSGGEVYLSQADHLCPDDCSEPDFCPVSGESRSPALYEKLSALSLPGFRLLVIPTRQLAPGVGGYPPRELLDLARQVAASEENLLIATACRCHGVVHALRRRKAGG
jgi:hypothetical protein|uniref:RCK N-terminal domain-containing protein n=1 Tax=Desulfobacca acetoxidans TaxID=60893 RepID=A0A7C3SJ02_9BACT